MWSGNARGSIPPSFRQQLKIKMKKFVIGYLSEFECELRLEVVDAEDELSALINYLGLRKEKEDYNSVEKIFDYCANSDSYINILEL